MSTFSPVPTPDVRWHMTHVTHSGAVSDAVALMELGHLVVTDTLMDWTQRQLAKRWLCSPGRARRIANKLANHWRTSDGPAANHYRTSLSKRFPHLTRSDEPPANHPRTTREPTRALPYREKEKEIELPAEPADERQLYEAWRTLGKGRRKKPSASRLKYLRARIKQDGLSTCLLVNEWVHKAPSGKWWRDHEVTNIEALYKADKWDSRVEKAQVWDESGRPEGDAPNAADHKQDAEKWFSAVHGLASAGKKPKAVEEMLEMLGHAGTPSERAHAAWSALTGIGRCSVLGEANQFEVHALRKSFVSAYTAARCNETATSPVEAT